MTVLVWMVAVIVLGINCYFIIDKVVCALFAVTEMSVFSLLLLILFLCLPPPLRR